MPEPPCFAGVYVDVIFLKLRELIVIGTGSLAQTGVANLDDTVGLITRIGIRHESEGKCASSFTDFPHFCNGFVDGHKKTPLIYDSKVFLFFSGGKDSISIPQHSSPKDFARISLLPKFANPFAS